MKRRRKKHSTKTFQRQVLGFSVATIVVLAVIIYFSFSHTVIVVTPRLLTLPVETNIQIAAPSNDAPKAENAPEALPGTLLELTSTGTTTYTGSSEQREEPARAGGIVVLHNGWSKAQPLQAGTRLLSEDGILFRTTERVDIPVGGSIEAAVLADEPGTQGEVPPGRFTIVALWPGLQELIYGESTTAFTGGIQTLSRVAQSDLNAARRDALEMLKEEGSNLLEAERIKQGLSGELVAIAVTASSENAGASVGDELASFTYTVRGTVTGIVMEADQLHEALLTTATTQLTDGEQFLALAEEAPDVQVTAVNATAQTATLHVTTTAQASLNLTSPVFDRAALTSKERGEIITHFDQFDSVASVEVRFSPFWVFRSPALADHIEIQLQDPVEK